MNSTELDPMAEMSNDLDDLGNLFEFGDIDLNTIPDPAQYGEHVQQQQHGTHPNTPFHDMSEPPPMPGTSAHDFGGHDHQYAMSQGMEQQQQQQHYAGQHDNRAPTSNPYGQEPLYQPSMQQQQYPYHQNYQYQPRQGFPPNNHVPPTPNSYEMHGETGRFMQQPPQLDPQQRAILEQRYHLRKDDAIAFTPMVSPAGTPQYNMMPEFTTPGAYFSPLTSPMLHAQNQQAHLQQQQHQQGYLTNPSTAPSSNVNSPIDPNLDIEMLDGMRQPESTGPKTRKSRRKPPTTKSGVIAARAKQSPAQSAQKRKSVPLAVSQAGAEHLAPRSVTSQPSSAGLSMPSQFDSSETESISPEPLSESVMGPPPRPGSSLTQSPALTGQQQQQGGASAVGAAATPKSLLTRRSNTQPINGQKSPYSSETANELGGLDDLSLPESATGQHRPALSQINTQIPPISSDSTPRMSSRKTPKLGPESTPSSARPRSAIESPSIMGSPMTASTPSAILRDNKDVKGRRTDKKRGSMSANSSKLVSPALVPKISPSIKPLLPEGTPLHSATQAMLLASKSNYQNLMEGNHLPGVSYPDSLSTGLTSKRTSHKVAEQGRRNRINEALKEMQCLVPKQSNSSSRSPNGPDENGDGSPEGGEDGGADGNNVMSKEDANVKSNSSKAATVELANDYIRRMQKESAIQNAEVMQLKRENEALRKRLAEQSGSPMDSPSATNASESPAASLKA